MDSLEIEFRKTILLHHINNYLSMKKVKMKGLLKNLKLILEGDNKITVKQLESIVPFLDKEKHFKGWNRKQIVNFFQPLLRNYKGELYGTID